MVKIIAVIPARGGSKRIKNKNIKLFFGKPMIAWTIIAAKKAKVFKRILVSTDNIKIAKIAKKYGAEVPFLRPKKLAGDKITTFVASRPPTGLGTWPSMDPYTFPPRTESGIITPAFIR